MAIDDPRVSSVEVDFDGAFGVRGDEAQVQDEEVRRVLLAQADAGPVDADPNSGQDPQQNLPAEVTPDANNVVHLPAGVTSDDIRVDGTDLVLVQADGSEIRILGASLDIPTFVIGDVEVPREVLLAVLSDNGINVAAGPDGTLSVVGGGPQGSGAEFQDGLADFGGDQNQVLDLLGDATGGNDVTGEEDQLAGGGNRPPQIVAPSDLAGTMVESDDVPGGTDPDPVPVTGTISFADENIGDTRTASITERNVVSTSITHGPTLTQAQIDALLAGFTLDSPGGITTEPTATSNGTINWTYALGNDTIDFLAEGETIVLQ